MSENFCDSKVQNLEKWQHECTKMTYFLNLISVKLTWIFFETFVYWHVNFLTFSDPVQCFDIVFIYETTKSRKFRKVSDIFDIT